jgi:hypothetical protein
VEDFEIRISDLVAALPRHESLYYNPSISCYFCTFLDSSLRNIFSYNELWLVLNFSFLSFEFVSYFDIRISSLDAAKGRAKSVRVFCHSRDLSLPKGEGGNPVHFSILNS